MLLAALVVVGPPPGWGAACPSACKDEIAACRAGDCAGLRGKARRHCRRTCAKTLVRDCYADLTVCGATTARPKQRQPAGGAGGGGGVVPGPGGW